MVVPDPGIPPASDIGMNSHRAIATTTLRRRPAGRRRDGLAVAVILFGSIAGAAGAEDLAGDAPRMSLAALIDEALVRNPQIRASAQRVEAARAMVPQARTLPDPMINLGYEDMPERETMYGVSQEIPFPGKLRLRGEVASREAEQVEQEYQAVRLAVIAQLKQAYYELHLAHKTGEVLEKNRQLLADIAATTTARYEVGEGVQADVFRAQAEVSRILARLATLRQQQRSIGAELNRLLNRPAAEPVGVAAEVTVTRLRRTLPELTELADQSAPRLRAQMKAVERGNAAVALARREYLPDFEIAAQGLHEEPMGDNGYRVMLNVTIPLFYGTKQRYGVREAQAGREEASGDLQALRQDLTAQVADNVALIERASQLIKLLEAAIIPQARSTFVSARASYGVGKVDFLTLLSSLFTLQENELELHAEIVEHEKARARIEEILGEAP